MLLVWKFVLDLVAVLRMTDDEKDLEIMLLRQQLRIVERKQKRGARRFHGGRKCTVLVLQHLVRFLTSRLSRKFGAPDVGI
jgi:hypothetical protein